MQNSRIQFQTNHNLNVRGLVRFSDFKDILPFGKTKFYELIGKGQFPKPIKIGPRISAWKLPIVQQWIDDVNSGKIIIS